MRELASALRARTAEQDADEYVERLTTAATQAAREALSVDVEDLVELINAIPDDEPNPQERLAMLRRQVLAKYSQMSSAAFADVVERSEILAAMSGRFGAVKDV